MHILKKLFLLNRIYSKRTLEGIAYDIMWVAVLGIVVWRVLEGYPEVVGLLIILIIYIVCRELLRNYIVSSHIKHAGYQSPTGVMQSMFFRSATNEELNSADKTQLVIEGADWKLFDAQFDFYRKTKYGSYLSRQVYYTVFEIQLNRVVPNLLFDSKRAKGQQFSYTYLSSQKLSLEGNFDKYFTTYAPDFYEIDTLSFITPEVMHELIAASDYDIELLEDRLFMYAPLLDGSQLMAMQTIGQRLRTALNDNLDTYRDSFLVGKARVTQSTPFARKLQKSPLKPALVVSATLVALLIMILLAFKGTPEVLFGQGGLLVLVFLGSYGYKLYKILKDNREMKENFDFTRRYAELLNQKQHTRLIH